MPFANPYLNQGLKAAKKINLLKTHIVTSNVFWLEVQQVLSHETVTTGLVQEHKQQMLVLSSYRPLLILKKKSRQHLCPQ